MTHRTAPWRKGSLGMVVVLLLSACGSTVQWSETIAGVLPGEELQGDGLDLANPGRDGDGVGPHPNAEDSRRSPGEFAGADGTRTPGGTRTADGTRTPGGATIPPAGKGGRGFTDKEIYIGVDANDDAKAAYEMAGSDTDPGNYRAQTNTIVKDINRRGGIAGRKVVPVFHNYNNAQALQNPHGSVQAACTRWTEDQPVFAVVALINVLGGDNTLAACLAQRRTPLVSLSSVARPQSTFHRYEPYLYSITHPSFDTLVPPWIRRLVALDYFKGGWDIDPASPGPEPTKIGIVGIRCQFAADYKRILRQELDKHSQTVVAEAEASCNLSRLGDEMGQAALRFRNAGVTHVFGEHSILRFFATAAESQQYRPRYAVTSNNAPQQGLQDMPEAREQLHGALGVGYSPTFDVDWERDPGPTSAAQTHCRKLMLEAGERADNRDAFDFMVRRCDGFNFLAAATAKGSLSPEGLKKGAQAMRSMPSAHTFRFSFTGGRQDAPAAVRDLGYRGDCACFKYLSSKNHGM